MIGREFLQAGSFNLRLAVLEPVDTPDGCGGHETVWSEAFKLWVRLVPVKNILNYRANNDDMEVTHWIVLRRRDDLTRSMRFASESGERIFEVDTLHDPDETGRYLLAQVREIEKVEAT